MSEHVDGEQSLAWLAKAVDENLIDAWVTVGRLCAAMFLTLTAEGVPGELAVESSVRGSQEP